MMDELSPILSYKHLRKSLSLYMVRGSRLALSNCIRLGEWSGCFDELRLQPAGEHWQPRGAQHCYLCNNHTGHGRWQQQDCQPGSSGGRPSEATTRYNFGQEGVELGACCVFGERPQEDCGILQQGA